MIAHQKLFCSNEHVFVTVIVIWGVFASLNFSVLIKWGRSDADWQFSGWFPDSLGKPLQDQVLLDVLSLWSWLLVRVPNVPNIQNEVALRVVSNVCGFQSDPDMQMLRKEGNVEPIKHRDVWQEMGRVVEAKPTDIRTFIRTPMLTWTEGTKQLKNRHCSYERQLFTSENERRLRTLFVNGVVSPAPSKQEHNLWCPFCWFSNVCAEHRSHGGVATMHNGAANKALVNVSNIGCGTSAKTRPQKYKLALGKSSCFAGLYFTQHAKKWGRTSWTNTHANAA